VRQPVRHRNAAEEGSLVAKCLLIDASVPSESAQRRKRVTARAINDPQIASIPKPASSRPTPDVTKRAFRTAPQSARSHSASPQYAQMTPTGTARTDAARSRRSLREFLTTFRYPGAGSELPGRCECALSRRLRLCGGRTRGRLSLGVEGARAADRGVRWDSSGNASRRSGIRQVG